MPAAPFIGFFSSCGLPGKESEAVSVVVGAHGAGRAHTGQVGDCRLVPGDCRLVPGLGAALTTRQQSLGSRIQSLGSVIGFFWVVPGRMSVFGILPESAQGFTHPAHHEIADYLSFLVLFSPWKTVCAFCREEAPTPPPSTVTPDFLGIWYQSGVSKRRMFTPQLLQTFFGCCPHACYASCCAHPCCCFCFCGALWCCWWICRMFWAPFRHLGSLTAANWVSFDFNVSYSSC